MVTDGTNIYPALSLDMLRIATANESLGIKMDQDGVYGIIVRPNIVKTDETGRIWLYASRHDRRNIFSVKDVINGTVDKTQDRRQAGAGRHLVGGAAGYSHHRRRRPISGR